MLQYWKRDKMELQVICKTCNRLIARKEAASEDTLQLDKDHHMMKEHPEDWQNLLEIRDGIIDLSTKKRMIYDKHFVTRGMVDDTA